jgi:hypothetical protein
MENKVSAIVPLEGAATLPAYLKKRAELAQINSDVLSSGPSFPSLSIKGKVFTMVKGGERKVLTRIVDGEEEPRPTVQLVVVRANNKARVYYDKGYVEGDSDGARPTCFTHDGIAPSANAIEPQAKKCQACPHAVWGSKVAKPGDEEGGKGTACTVNSRLAVIDPDNPDTPFLLRVPAGSKRNYQEVVKLADNRQMPYNALALRVGFDAEAPSPRLTFKVIGVVSDPLYEKIEKLYQSDEIKEIVGLTEVAQPKQEDESPKGPVAAQELDEALSPSPATKEEVAAVIEQAKTPAPKPAPPKPKNPPPPVVDAGASALLSELDALLGAKDD